MTSSYLICRFKMVEFWMIMLFPVFWTTIGMPIGCSQCSPSLAIVNRNPYAIDSFAQSINGLDQSAVCGSSIPQRKCHDLETHDERFYGAFAVRAGGILFPLKQLTRIQACSIV